MIQSLNVSHSKSLPRCCCCCCLQQSASNYFNSSQFLLSVLDLVNNTMSTENNVDANATESRVIQLIENAIECNNESEKVSFLVQAQEFVIHHDILDNFLDELLGFQNDRYAEVRKFVAGFIEATCKKEPEYFPKVIVNLNLMLADEVPNVLKKAIQVSTQLYRVFLVWLSKSKITDEIESTWEVWSQIKNHIFSLIDITENDGVRTQCIKFIENVIICQTKRDTFSTENDFSLDQVTLEEHKLIDAEALEEEAVQLFEQLVAFQAKIHISSVNLMATMQSLSLIARQRSKLFFNKVVQAFETLRANLPPTLAKSQVNSVNKQLKLLFLILFKHPFVYSTKQHPKLSQILLEVGASQSEINRCLSDVRKRGIKTDFPLPFETKRIKLEPKDDDVVEEKADIKDTTRGVPEQPPSFNLDSALYELSKKFSRHEASKASDITAKDLARRLSNVDVVSDLVLSSLHLLPDQITDSMRSALSSVDSSGNSNQIAEIAKHLSTQFTSCGIGLGVDEVITKYSNIFFNVNKVKVDSEINRKISSLIKKCIIKEMKKQESHQHKVKLTQSGKSMTSAAKIKHFDLLDVTKPLETVDKCKYIESSIVRILNEDKYGHFSTKQLEIRHKILGKFLSEFASFGPLKTLIKEYIFKDIRNRYDILLNMIYNEYVEGKRNSSLDYYGSCLIWVIESIINSCDTKDRDFFLNKFYSESPLLTDNVLDLLKKFILSSPSTYADCANSGITLVKVLIEKKAKHRERLLDILLQVCTETTNTDAQKTGLQTIKELYQDEKLCLSKLIEEFSLKQLNKLVSSSEEDAAKKENAPPPPPAIPTTTQDESLSDDAIKSCISLYFLLLPINQKLIHELPEVYVKSNGNIKRTILRLIQSAIQSIDMNSPEILVFVEKCPEGAETLVSRVIHILTEKKPPSAALVTRVKELYQKRVPDVRFLIPVLTGLSKKEIIAILPQLIKLNPIVVREQIFHRLLLPRGDSSTLASPISPADLMIALHNIDLSMCDLKTVMKATNLCFEEKNIYTAEVLAVVMQLLIEQNPLPTLLMRTVIQTLSSYPRLINFVMNNILQRLIVKQVWSQKKELWHGFVKCCQKTVPQSFTVLLQLQQPQLKSVFEICPEIKSALANHLQTLNEQQMAHISQSLLDLITKPENPTIAV